MQKQILFPWAWMPQSPGVSRIFALFSPNIHGSSRIITLGANHDHVPKSIARDRRNHRRRAFLRRLHARVAVLLAAVSARPQQHDPRLTRRTRVRERRLAIRDGDVRSAEKYLVASGRIDEQGDAVLDSYGPNLSLALEVLKHGDRQSRQAVVRFLDEIKIFWENTPAPFDWWKAQITTGEIPNFMAVGVNLYY